MKTDWNHRLMRKARVAGGHILRLDRRNYDPELANTQLSGCVTGTGWLGKSQVIK